LMSWAVTKNSSSHPSFPGGISTTSAQGRWKDSKQTCSCMRWCINNASSPCRLRIEIFVACMYVMAWLNCLLGYSRVSHEVRRNKIKWSNNGKWGLEGWMVDSILLGSGTWVEMSSYAPGGSCMFENKWRAKD
jgi:hypothetical protein